MNQKISSLARKKSFRELIKYGIVGVIGLAIDMGIFYLLINKYAVHYPFSSTISTVVLGGNMSVSMLDKLISNIISSTLAVINNFILNSYFTFKVTDNKLKRFVSFAGIAIIGLIVSSMLLTLFIGVLQMNDMLAKAISIIIVAMLQFIINKLVTFKPNKNY